MSSRTSRPLRLGLVIAAAVLITTGGGALVVRLAGGDGWTSDWPVAQQRSESAAREVAEHFLRTAAAQEPARSCLSVAANGAIGNTCRDNLGHRQDYRELVAVDRKVHVRGVDLQDERARVVATDLSPRPGVDLTLGLHDTRDGWRVRVLNGQPIAWKESG